MEIDSVHIEKTSKHYYKTSSVLKPTEYEKHGKKKKQRRDLGKQM
jgi:hypothetical protein